MTQPIYRYLLLLILSSCGAYNQNVMFKTDMQRLPATLATSVSLAEKNYLIQKNDYLEVQLFANKGENLINFNIQTYGSGNNTITGQAAQAPRFLVQENGYVKLPMVGSVKLEGFTLHQADSLLEKAYTAFYEEPFVNTRYANKRVILLGSTKGQVIPLINENMNLIEVIALSGGVDLTARVSNIRLIRGDLKNPEVYLIDLSTIEGMTQANLKVQPNDIVYIEPARRPFRESLADITPILGLITSIFTLIILSERLF